MNEELAKSCKTSHVYTNWENLALTTEDFLKDETTAAVFLYEHVGNKESDLYRELNGETTEISTCSDPSIQCLTRTHINTVQPSKLPKLPLNINLLYDFYLAPIYIGQVPVKAEFEAFWQAVDEFNVQYSFSTHNCVY